MRLVRIPAATVQLAVTIETLIKDEPIGEIDILGFIYLLHTYTRRVFYGGGNVDPT